MKTYLEIAQSIVRNLALLTDVQISHKKKRAEYGHDASSSYDQTHEFPPYLTLFNRCWLKTKISLFRIFTGELIKRHHSGKILI